MLENQNRYVEHKGSNKDFETDFEDYYKNYPLTEETKSGIWLIKGPKIQALANKKYVIAIIALTGCFISSIFSYFGGTITTLEKRYKISTKTTGIILIGNDIPKIVASIVLTYYTSFGHRPRWIAIGLLLTAVFCFLNAFPHLIYGPGYDALQLTFEHGADFRISNNDTRFDNCNNHLCNPIDNEECVVKEGSIITPLILFVSQIIVGVGTSFYHSLAFSYLDDNVKKTKSPFMFSLTNFTRMLGPALGYAIVSACLKIFIDPTLTPVIDNTDPRWLGAWWIGWLILGPILIILAALISIMPKKLPRAAARKEFFRQKYKMIEESPDTKPSIKDLIETLKRLLKNKIYICTMFSSIFCIFGYNPYWIYLPKYIEIQYKKTASAASLVTGTTGLIFAGVGILFGGIVVQKIKPKARSVALWNCIVDVVFVTGVIVYSFLGCDAVDGQMANFSNRIDKNLSCNANCDCDFIKFSPVCAIGLNKTYISACHAGCTQQNIINNGTIVFSDCSCIPFQNTSISTLYENITDASSTHGFAISGPCDVNCQYEFYIFIFVKCLTKMLGAMTKVSFFLIAIRCISERDKSVSLGFSSAMVGILALLPSPIFFGYIIDSTCLMWGKTHTEMGNCWFYDTKLLRNRLSYTSAFFIFIGVIFDLFIVKQAKDLNIFDENSNPIKNTEENIKLMKISTKSGS